MSCDFAVWHADGRLTATEAGEGYERLCHGDRSGLAERPSLEAFYRELTALHPEVDDVPDDRVDDDAYCPGSIAMDRSPGHLIVSCVWPRADYVRELLERLARKHRLALYDPRTGTIVHPDDSHGPAARRPWWRLW
jgi:hypothetical protein